MMSEYAPSSFGIARLTLSSIDAELSLSRMIIFEIISASLVVWNMDPSSSSLSLVSAELTRLPLKHSAMCPFTWLTTIG